MRGARHGFDTTVAAHGGTPAYRLRLVCGRARESDIHFSIRTRKPRVPDRQQHLIANSEYIAAGGGCCCSPTAAPLPHSNSLEALGLLCAGASQPQWLLVPLFPATRPEVVPVT